MQIWNFGHLVDICLELPIYKTIEVKGNIAYQLINDMIFMGRKIITIWILIHICCAEL